MTLCRSLLLATLAALLLLPTRPLRAAETAETILIRQALEKDRSGRRRGDAELVMSAYDEDGFITWDAKGFIDGRGWSVRHPSRQATATALQADLAARRYDIARTVLHIHVWKDMAFATTVDSGAVVEAGGARRAFTEDRLWTFRKVDDEWFATGTLIDIGDTTAGPGVGRVEAQDVVAALRRDATAWTEGSAGDILSGYAGHVALVESHYSSNPVKWLVVFAGQEEVEEWLADRLDRVDYSVERTVLHAVAQGDAAVAVSRDRVAATYASGTATVEQDRTTTWLLRRHGGTWRAEWVWWKAKPFADTDATALR